MRRTSRAVWGLAAGWALGLLGSPSALAQPGQEPPNPAAREGASDNDGQPVGDPPRRGPGDRARRRGGLDLEGIPGDWARGGMDRMFWVQPRTAEEIAAHLTERYALTPDQLSTLRPEVEAFAQERAAFWEANAVEIEASTEAFRQLREQGENGQRPSREEWQQAAERFRTLQDRSPAKPEDLVKSVEARLPPEQVQEARQRQIDSMRQRAEQWQQERTFWDEPRSTADILDRLAGTHRLSDAQKAQLEPLVRNYAELRNAYLKDNQEQIDQLKAERDALRESFRQGQRPDREKFRSIRDRAEALRLGAPVTWEKLVAEVEGQLPPEQVAQAQRSFRMLNGRSPAGRPVNSPNLRLAGKPDPWQAVVTAFIRDHGLDEARAVSAQGIMKEQRLRHAQLLTSKQAERETLASPNATPEAKKAAQATLDQVDQQCLDELKARLEKLL